MEHDARLQRLRRYAHLLDEGIGLPGTRFRIGIDPLLGLIPGLGDAAGAALAAWILVEAVRRRASRATLIRLAMVIAFDALLGALPVVGDLFDFVFKANMRNVELLERHAAEPVGARRSDRLFVALLLGAIFLLFAGLLVAGVFVIVRLFHILKGG
jgi:hypothetical protein